MIEGDEAPFGQRFYEQQQRLWGYTASDYEPARTRKEYIEARDAAIADPSFDFFEQYLPTGRSKHDIGYYALRNGLNVPLITSIDELRDAAADGTIFVRSDGPDEYNGPSGLRNSSRIGRVDTTNRHTYPFDRVGDDEELILGVFNGVRNRLEGATSLEALRDLNRLATQQILSGNMYPGVRENLYPRDSSVWRLIQGDNISIMRDPVQEDLYHFRWGQYVSSKIRRDSYDEGYPVFRFGDGQAKHNQRKLDSGGDVTDAWFGSYYPDNQRGFYHIPTDIEGAWRSGEGTWLPSPSGLPEFWAPVSELVAAYEKVRTLPLFDQRQVPVMEMQYDRTQQKLHFLQYLKTGRVLENIEAFVLPKGPTVVKGLDVVGATKPEGERMRIHIGVTSQNATAAEPIIKQEGVLLPEEMILMGGGYLQRLALLARAAFIDYRLTFHNHHFGSAMFTRTPLSVGLMDWSNGDLAQQLLGAHYEYQRNNQDGSIGYVNAVVTSNGREVTVESDWKPHRADGESDLNK